MERISINREVKRYRKRRVERWNGTACRDTPWLLVAVTGTHCTLYVYQLMYPRGWIGAVCAIKATFKVAVVGASLLFSYPTGILYGSYTHLGWMRIHSFFFLFPFFLSFPLPFRFSFFLFVVNFFFSTFLSSSLPTFSIDYFCSTLRLQCVCRLVIDTPPYEISWLYNRRCDTLL